MITRMTRVFDSAPFAIISTAPESLYVPINPARMCFRNISLSVRLTISPFLIILENFFPMYVALSSTRLWMRLLLSLESSLHGREYRAFEKTLEVYDVVTRFSRPTTISTSHEETFHLAHGDFSSYNVLIDPDTVTDIDWEMAGFRSAWLAAVGGGWFNDDSERFLMTDDQSDRGNYADESPADAITRSQFRL
jgi:RIO1 family